MEATDLGSGLFDIKADKQYINSMLPDGVDTGVAWVRVTDVNDNELIDTFKVWRNEDQIDDGTSITLNETSETSSTSDLTIYPNPVSQLSNSLNILIPSRLLGNWSMKIYDVLGNLMDETEFRATGTTTYSWDLHSKYGTRVASGSYVLIAKYTDSSGKSEISKRMIGVRK